MRIPTKMRVGMVALPALVVLLAGCGGGNTTSTGPSSAPSTSTGANATALAHPKKVTGAGECHQLADASTVTEVTTLTATTQSASGDSADCSFDLATKAGADAGQVTIALGPNHAGVHGTATAVQVDGNPAQRQKLSGLSAGQDGCSVFVTLNGTRSLNTLTVTVLTFQPGPDTCTTAGALAIDAFTKLPAA